MAWHWKAEMIYFCLNSLSCTQKNLLVSCLYSFTSLLDIFRPFVGYKEVRLVIKESKLVSRRPLTHIFSPTFTDWFVITSPELITASVTGFFKLNLWYIGKCSVVEIALSFVLLILKIRPVQLLLWVPCKVIGFTVMDNDISNCWIVFFIWS